MRLSSHHSVCSYQGGSAALFAVGFASFPPGRLDGGLALNSPCCAGSARYAKRASPFFSLPSAGRASSGKIQTQPPSAPLRGLTTRFAGLFTTASPAFESLIALRLSSDVAVRSTPKAGGQAPLGRCSTAATAAQQSSGWGRPPAFSSPGGELRVLAVSFSVRLGRTLKLSSAAPCGFAEPQRKCGAWAPDFLGNRGRLPCAGLAFWGTLAERKVAERFPFFPCKSPTSATLVAFRVWSLSAPWTFLSSATAWGQTAELSGDFCGAINVVSNYFNRGAWS